MRPPPSTNEARAARTNQVLRIGGLALIAVAFLSLTRSLTNGGDAAPTTTASGPGPLTVFAVPALRGVLPPLAPTAKFTYGSAIDLQARIAKRDKADLLITDDPSALEALTQVGRCTTPIPFATGGATPEATPSTPASTAPGTTPAGPTYAYCVVIRAGVDTKDALIFTEALTGLAGRTGLLSAGFGVPAKRTG